jgi:hypothetical protein
MKRWKTVLYAMAIGSPIAAAAFILVLPWPHEAAERRQCDSAVHTALTTHDEIELQRAAFIVNWLNCSVGHRLPEVSSE